MRRWSEEKPSVRLLLVAFVLVLTGALVWAGWFASDSQNATWSPFLITIAVIAGPIGAVIARRRSWMSRSRRRDLLACGRPGRGEPSRSRGRGSRWSRSLRPAVVPPARPYPLIAPFREHPRVLALLAAAGSASVFAVVMRGAGGGQRPGPASGRAVRFVMGGLGGCHRDW